MDSLNLNQFVRDGKRGVVGWAVGSAAGEVA